MAKQDTMDFVAAFAIGAVLGVGATLLLRGGNESDAQRLIRELAPLRKKAGKRMRRARKTWSSRARAAGAASERAVESGREAVGDIRGQIADIVDTARREITHAARESVREARRAAKRAVR